MIRAFITVQLVELVAVALAGVSSFVELHVWKPAYTYYLLLLLVGLEVLVNGYLNKKPLRPHRLALRLLAYTVLLGFAHGFAVHEPGLTWLGQLALAPFVIVHLRRLIIAFGKLDLVDSDVSDLLQKGITKAATDLDTAVAAPAAPTPPTDANVSPEPQALPGR